MSKYRLTKAERDQIEVITEELRERGFYGRVFAAVAGKHTTVRCDGMKFIISRTPSDHRAVMNARSCARRVIREHLAIHGAAAFGEEITV
jgi:hypothetical protein